MKGAATWIPLLYDARRGSTGGSQDARYCYTVWMRHLLALHRCSPPPRIRSVAEIGPGDSLGIGIAALLSGAERLQAFDVVPYASAEHNLTVLGELVDLFRSRAPVPDAREFPGVFPRLSDPAFPESLWSPGALDRLLSAARVEAIAASLRGQRGGPIDIRYTVPWNAVTDAAAGTVDLVYSQAVLEHVDDLPGTYAAIAGWLAPGACSSHVIDFRSHHITPGWDGHLQYPEGVWRLVRGRRPYLLNRRSPSDHLAALADHGFEVLHVDRESREPTVPVASLAPEFRGRSDEDRATASMHVIARRLHESEMPGAAA